MNSRTTERQQLDSIGGDKYSRFAIICAPVENEMLPRTRISIHPVPEWERISQRLGANEKAEQRAPGRLRRCMERCLTEKVPMVIICRAQSIVLWCFPALHVELSLTPRAPIHAVIEVSSQWHGSMKEFR